MIDLIDRQAAIDAVNNAFDRETLLTGFVRSIAVRAIRDTPSAQPMDMHEAYYRGKADGVRECTAKLRSVNKLMDRGKEKDELIRWIVDGGSNNEGDL